jgi:hypothetical protein
VSEDAAAYVLDAETFGALRRLVGRLRGDGSLVGDERRNLANRMNALLQKAQPQHPAKDDKKQALRIARLPTL